MNKSKLIVIISMLGVLFMFGCGFRKEENHLTYEKISQEEAKRLMDQEEEYILLDVRTKEEFSQKHIPGAICIPNENIEESVTKQLPDKDVMLLVYCRSGNRSKQAAKKLVKLGYTNVKEFGGIITWPYEVE